jgi:uncharacterized protein
MELTLVFIATAIFIGGLVGLLTGIFGVGGGFILTPLLMICMAVPAPIAVGSGLAVILINSSWGLYKRRGSDTVDIKLSFIITGGSIFGVLAGSKILKYLSNAPNITILGREQDTVEYTLLVFFLILLGSIAAYLFYDYRKHNGKAPDVRIGLFARYPIKPLATFKSLEAPNLSLPLLVVFGFVVGLLTGLLGVGGGVILLPALVYLVGQRTVKAAGTSLLLVWAASLAAVVQKGLGGDIDVPLAVSLLIGGLLGTSFGTKIGLKIRGPKIRLYFVYVVIAAALIVAYEVAKLTFGITKS